VDKDMTPEDLISFEAEIAELFNAGKIRSVIHLYSGGEEPLIRIFEDIRPQDWVLCTWRSHYQCLLKGVDREELKQKIVDGYSIALCFPSHRIVSSGIFGGMLPVAVGLAMGIKRAGEDSRVHCFLGDMAAQSGIFHESVKYSEGHDLPIQFHIENNGISVCTNTEDVWGISNSNFGWEQKTDEFHYKPGRFPHSGAGKRVEF
jgi:TPP-dependent pyruvate/acetoin dehydrogenase alpha subunit